MMRLKRLLASFICLFFVFGLVSCDSPGKRDTKDAKVSLESDADTADNADNGEEKNTEAPSEDGGELPFTFRDAHGQAYTTSINPDVPINRYSFSGFEKSGEKMSYEDEYFTSRLGVDVSHHQGEVDWQKVSADGYDFAFLRIAYRGYGKEGSLNADKEFLRNYENATKAGLELGVYVFSQAINEEEALEEAEFVLSILDGRSLNLPVVFDPESILDAEARTDNVSGEQFTKNTVTFCERIKDAGYEPAVYSNMKWEAFFFDMEAFDYPIWYADYEDVPQTPYDFKYWQYSESGNVDGIEGGVDLNIMMVEK